MARDIARLIGDPVSTSNLHANRTSATIGITEPDYDHIVLALGGHREADVADATARCVALFCVKHAAVVVGRQAVIVRLVVKYIRFLKRIARVREEKAARVALSLVDERVSRVVSYHDSRGSISGLRAKSVVFEMIEFVHHGLLAFVTQQFGIMVFYVLCFAMYWSSS